MTVIGDAAPGTMHIIELASVLISAPAVSIPEAIEVDVTGIEAGNAVRVADLVLPENVEAMTDAGTDIVNLTTSSDTSSDEPEPEADAEAE